MLKNKIFLIVVCVLLAVASAALIFSFPVGSTDSDDDRDDAAVETTADGTSTDTAPADTPETPEDIVAAVYVGDDPAAYKLIKREEFNATFTHRGDTNIFKTDENLAEQNVRIEILDDIDIGAYELSVTALPTRDVIINGNGHTITGSDVNNPVLRVYGMSDRYTHCNINDLNIVASKASCMQFYHGVSTWINNSKFEALNHKAFLFTSNGIVLTLNTCEVDAKYGIYVNDAVEDLLIKCSDTSILASECPVYVLGDDFDFYCDEGSILKNTNYSSHVGNAIYLQSEDYHSEFFWGAYDGLMNLTGCSIIGNIEVSPSYCSFQKGVLFGEYLFDGEYEEYRRYYISSDFSLPYQDTYSVTLTSNERVSFGGGNSVPSRVLSGDSLIIYFWIENMVEGESVEIVNTDLEYELIPPIDESSSYMLILKNISSSFDVADLIQITEVSD